ncbi:restriction endonuclease subunit S [Gordonia hongkongensis]|uniref:Restriction endonuclease subunit S n=1 Tax=Gordonia hongkongensis TaxID=1701090 RepID=A0AAX3TEF5_9ACTN|nr:restriction endonuclease subunit S [Gordonia hongkongensis]WFP27340.1 restriction endonuclease subunit S [Gordonia hongkongensis]
MSLGEICEFKYGKSLPAKQRVPGQVAVYGSNGQVGTHESSISSGVTIVVGRKGSLGEVHLAPGSCWPIDTTYFIDSSATEADLHWLYHRLKGLNLTSLNRAAAVPGLNREDAYRQRLLLPPLPEQRRIAAILDHADALRAKRRESIARLDELSQSIFHDMFSTLEWNAKFDSIISAGPTNGLYRPASDYGAGVPILRIDGFASGAVLSDSHQWKRLRADREEIQQYSLVAGDLVVNRVNALSHLGKSALISAISEPSVYESNMMRVRIDANRANSDFVLAWLQTRRAKQQILRKAKKAINQASINQADVKSLVLPLPPLELQYRFAERVEAVRVERAASERFNASADDLFYSLQSRAFRGEL